MRLTCLMVFSLISNGLLWAGEIVLSGAYQGKDIFVQNPWNRSTSGFCTQAVYVNDRKVLENPRVSAFKIDLSYLTPNDLVVIRIEHAEGCRPTIINPYVLKAVTDFKFLSVEVDNNSIRWVTVGEKEEGQFNLEQLSEDQEWLMMDKVEARKGLSQNLYARPASHRKGENTYRVKYETSGGHLTYSLEVYYTHTDSLITFQPAIATSTITLSDSTEYRILDFQGKVVKKGNGRNILLTELRPGEYYLEIQNRREKFIKR